MIQSVFTAVLLGASLVLGSSVNGTFAVRYASLDVLRARYLT